MSQIYFFFKMSNPRQCWFTHYVRFVTMKLFLFWIEYWVEHQSSALCLVLLCDQNSFGRSKIVLVWPNWFGLDHNDLVTTKMNWSGLNVIHFGRKSQFGPDQFILVVTNSFWSRTNQHGQVQISLVRPKPFVTDQNYLGQIQGQGICVLPKQSKKNSFTSSI